MPVDRRALEAAPRLKVAVRSGVGFENFDLAAFAERGIPACNVPDYGSEEVAVHALSQILALRRQVVFYDRALRMGDWRGAPGEIPMRRLSKQTAGVIGLGRIGRAFAARAKALFGAGHRLRPVDSARSVRGGGRRNPLASTSCFRARTSSPSTCRSRGGRAT